MDFSLPNTTFSFSPDGPLAYPISIILLDDPFFEGREDFTLEIRTRMPRVELSPNVITVSIVDNEGNTLLINS